MKISWNRESFLVSLVVIMILFALGYYGYSYLVEPMKLSAESSSLIVEEQSRLLATYPPEDAALEENQAAYEETTVFLPDSEAISEALVRIEQSAQAHTISITNAVRIHDQQAFEAVSGEYVQSTYQVELESESIDSIRRYIDSLMNEDRLWSVSTLSIQKQGESSYIAHFMLDMMYRQSP